MPKPFQTLYKISSNLINIPGFKTIVSRGCRQINFTDRNHSSSGNLMKVTIVGGAGTTGQSLCLLLKQSPLIDILSVHDLKPTSGFAMELQHIDTNCRITAFTGKNNLEAALDASKIVVILASAPEVNTLPVERMWSPNAHLVKDIVNKIPKCCPRAFITIATNPINSLVPMTCELLKKGGCYNPNTIFGVTTLDSVRANTFVAQVQGIEPECVIVPVIGGHTEETIVPVLSQAKPCAEFTNEELENITTNIRKAHENNLKLKPPDSAPLSCAFSVARFVISLIKAVQGYPDIIECALVSSKVHPQLKYLSTPLLLGPAGIVKNLGIPKLSDFENCMFNNAIPNLVNDIKIGEKYVGVQDPPPCDDPCSSDPRAPRCPQDWCK